MFIFSKGTPKTFQAICDRPNKWAGTKVHGTFREKDNSLKPRSSTWKEVVCKDFGSRFNVWEISEEKANKSGHPAVFPYSLARDHILTWSTENDLVFDPFLGSGTTRIAAYDTNRQFIGCEIAKEYFESQEERFQNHIAQTSMFVGIEKLDMEET